MNDGLDFNQLLALSDQNCRDAARLGKAIHRAPANYLVAARLLQQARNCLRTAERKVRASTKGSRA